MTNLTNIEVLLILEISRLNKIPGTILTVTKQYEKSHQRAEESADQAVPQSSLEIELPERHVLFLAPVHLQPRK